MLCRRLIPDTFAKCQARLLSMSKQHLYTYDLCQNADCNMVYRNDYKAARRCPLCKAARYDDNNRARTMQYLSLAEFLQAFFANKDLAR